MTEPQLKINIWNEKKKRLRWWERELHFVSDFAGDQDEPSQRRARASHHGTRIDKDKDTGAVYYSVSEYNVYIQLLQKVNDPEGRDQVNIWLFMDGFRFPQPGVSIPSSPLALLRPQYAQVWQPTT